MSFSPRLQALINAFRCLPGVGPKSAQRMALHLLERDQSGGLELANALQEAVNHIGRCEVCHTFSETPVCQVCDSSDRDKTTLCILETPVDLYAVEQTGGYNGLYFVLGGHLSP
ncbi:MAG: toprim domain-containing protein, partial [Pontibacterium sp.]